MAKKRIYCCEGCGRDTTNKSRMCDDCSWDEHYAIPRSEHEPQDLWDMEGLLDTQTDTGWAYDDE